jgi:N utilization substance protein A
MSEMADAIRELILEKGFSEDSVKQIIEKSLKSAYKKTYGTDENAIVKFNDDMSDVSLYSRKVVIDGVYNKVLEIELEEAKLLSPDVEEGDEIDILEDPKSYDRLAVSTGKQQAHQGLNEDLKKTLMNEYKDKIGEVIIGYYQRERNGNIYVDLGNAGKVEGYLPVKNQSKLEYYEKNDRIKALIVDIKPTNTGIQLILSRSDKKLVSSILEREVPEISDGTVEIINIVRDAGYRTKVAVYSKREEVDPVGACVGLKGVRIQNVINELSKEKIDVLKWNPDPTEFIKNALSPAQVERVVILDAEKRQALAIVQESQFSLAIGRQGQNVRLANKLCDWNIDVKTIEQAEEIDLSNVATVQNARNLFNDDYSEENYDEINSVSELPGVNIEIANLLKENGIDLIQDFVEKFDDNAIQIEGITKEDLDIINDLINQNVEFVDEEESENDGAVEEASNQENDESQDEDEYFCPECGVKITLDMTQCPNCGTEFEFEEDEE